MKTLLLFAFTLILAFPSVILGQDTVRNRLALDEVPSSSAGGVVLMFLQSEGNTKDGVAERITEFVGTLDGQIIQWDAGSGKWVLGTAGAGDVVDDLTPQLGGDLDTNGFAIQFDDNTGIQDNTGNELLHFQVSATPANYIEIESADAVSMPILRGTGSDPNVDLGFAVKGTGNFFFDSGGDFVIDLGDAAGADNFAVRDSGLVEVFAVDSDGNVTALGTVDGRDVSADGVKLDFVTITQAVDLDTMETDVAANTAKVTNATHTGEVTGSGTLTVHPTVISNKALVTAVATDMLLIEDATDGALKRVDVNDFLGSGNWTDVNTNEVELYAPTLTGPTNYERLSISVADGGDATIATEAGGTGLAGDLIFTAAADEKMRLTSVGELGIGRTPQSGYKLDVQGLGRCSTFRVDNGFFSGSLLELSNATSVRFSNYKVAPILFTNGAGATELMRIDSVGNVGIGLTDPQDLLEVAGGAILASAPTLNGATNYERLSISVADGGDATIATEAGGTGLAGDLILTGGNVGIGTTSPASELDVSGTAAATTFSASTAGRFDFGSTSYSIATTATSGFGLNFSAATNLNFRTFTSGAWRNNLHIQNDGNVGIGLTDPDTLLDVAGAVTQRELSADPSDPDEGSSVTWQSDGTGFGDDGDIVMKITAGGTTKTITLVDFSAATDEEP